jgi:hypothetical protein
MRSGQIVGTGAGDGEFYLLTPGPFDFVVQNLGAVEGMTPLPRFKAMNRAWAVAGRGHG